MEEAGGRGQGAGGQGGYLPITHYLLPIPYYPYRLIINGECEELLSYCHEVLAINGWVCFIVGAAGVSLFGVSC
jgi:hypothetical protein